MPVAPLEMVVRIRHHYPWLLQVATKISAMCRILRLQRMKVKPTIGTAAAVGQRTSQTSTRINTTIVLQATSVQRISGLT
jgi:hypothetical protein